MDTEKHLLLQKKINAGYSPNDEGPYYHHAFWETYKGGVKGKLGGMAVGATLGTAAGALMVGASTIIGGPIGALASHALLTLSGFAAAGMVYGAHEFSEIGKIVGGGAAQSQQLEERLKSFIEAKVAGVRKDIEQFKAEAKGEEYKPNPILENLIDNADHEDEYRRTHYASLESPKLNSLAFWKIALIGLVVGAIAGALFGGVGLATGLIGHGVGDSLLGYLGLAGDVAAGGAAHGVAHAATAATVGVSAAVFGLLGASYGVNRDIFRRIFDRTDSLFKGYVFGHSKVREQQVEAGQTIMEELNGHKEHKEVGDAKEAQYPDSTTYHRDRVIAATENARDASQTRVPL